MRLLLFPAAVAAIILAGASPAGATVVSQPFTSSGSWTVPADAGSVDILVVGAGGGGGGGGPSGPTPIPGGGGGGGEVKVCTGIPLTAGQSLVVTVGSGGSAANSNQVGNSGEPSSIAYGSSTLCSGSGGQGGNGGQVGPPYYQGGDSGNANSGGSSNSSQAGGGGAGAGGVGGNVSFPGGIGYAGDGGPGIAPGSLAGPGLFADVTATLYGGGGGGGRTDSNASAAGLGGAGGGAPGRPKSPGPAGEANTGGGGGGNGGGAGGGGGSGGSGYVVVRYIVLPANTTQPVVSGGTLVGESLSTTDGAWTESPSSFSYKWQRCDDDQGMGCVDISGATSSTYPTVSADAGKYLRSQVTATNAGGSVSANSSNYIRVTGPDPPEPPLPPLPSNRFTTMSAGSIGSTILTRVRVSGPGRISQAGTRSGSSRAVASALVCTDARTVSRAGSYTLACRANAATRRAQRLGAVRVVLRTAYTPTGGTERTKARIVVLPQLRPSYTG